MAETEKYLKFKAYLESIGGLKNGWFEGRAPITEPRYFEISEGWYPLVQELIGELIKLGWDKEIAQCKSKYAGLRFYINSAPLEVHQKIDEYEHKSYKICENCGDPGSLRNPKGWMETLCDKCYTKEPAVAYPSCHE